MTTKDKLSELLDKPTYHDVIWSVFALTGDSFTNDKRKIYDFFYRWRDRMPRGDELFFLDRPPVVFSEQVSRAIAILLGAIYSWVPSGVEYFWKEGVREKFTKRMYERFSEWEISVIEQMAEEFRTL